MSFVVYSLTMFFVRFLSLAFVAHVIVAGSCLVPMFSAHALHPEPYMGGVTSVADCEHCEHEDANRPTKSPCDEGHCFSPLTPAFIAHGFSLAEGRGVGGASMALASIAESIESGGSFHSDSEKPPVYARTVVLRL